MWNGNDPIEIGVASRAFSGEQESGDRHAVQPTASGFLITVVDGLGHGEEAAIASRTAIDTVIAHSTESLTAILKRCHESLRSTRGVVMSIAQIDTDTNAMTWLSVGNVEGILLRADPSAVPPSDSIMLRGGVVGYRLPSLRPAVHGLAPGDMILMATDGIMSGFQQNCRNSDQPQRLADEICRRFARNDDDALVLVARYRGSHP